jgi:bacteriorhodopsin
MTANFDNEPLKNIDTTVTPPQEKKKYRLNVYLKSSFTFTYIFLLTTATITFIEALRTSDPTVRHVMNLETAISLIAGYFYSIFTDRIQKAEDSASLPMTWKEMTQTRYIDWFMTTPLMLTVICLVLSKQLKKDLHFYFWFIVIVLNYSMLGIGYAGEMGYIGRWGADLLGFLPFVAMYGLIYHAFIKPKYVFSNWLIYGLYLVIWSFYGVAYLLDEITKNTVYNFLDLISKCIVGIGLWIFFTGIVKI